MRSPDKVAKDEVFASGVDYPSHTRRENERVRVSGLRPLRIYLASIRIVRKCIQWKKRDGN